VSTASPDAAVGLGERAPGGLGGFFDGILRQREFSDICENHRVVKQIGVRLAAILTLSAFYGMFMGIDIGWKQMLASALEVPILYLLTLFVCFPVLHVVNVLLGSRLGLLQTLALILSAITLNCILLASCAPIVLFFILTGADYSFQKLLHVLIFGFAGVWAMVALLRGLAAMCEHSSVYPKQALKILWVWMFVFGFVGTQMAWTLRPFVGAPNREFQIFRKQEGNFYRAVWQAMDDVLSAR